MTTRACPRCATAMPVDDRFVTWCDACDWNVDPVEPELPPGRVEALRHRLSQHHGERLYAEAQAGSGGEDPEWSRWDPAGVAAQAIALLVHGVTLALAVGGILLIVQGSVVPLLLGVILLAVAFVLRPRFPGLPDDLPVLRRAQAPSLFHLIDGVAEAVGTRGVDAVVVEADANAGVRPYGFARRRRALFLGLGLWEVLTPQQRVALLGHELGHYAHRDTRRGFLVRTALDCLLAWRYFLAPIANPNIAERLANWLMAVGRYPVHGLLALLDHLTLRASQRAEYRADDLAAHAGSAAAAVGLMDRLLITDTVEDRLRRESVRARSRSGRSGTGREAGQELWAALAEHVASVPEREYERRRRAGALRGHGVDSTHPPTHLRRQRLAAASQHPAAVLLGEERDEAVAAELADARARVARLVLRG
ncbi:M48 family metallopeptidase [Streptomyces triculaminicus]|uniref:M48 family metallopeptidase n=2 Tax=Streptomyces TaxID=1883 RepID=A0A939FNB0_9ACTN|nr:MULTISPECIES: M48 family metallopeptidase [Streptomyces]MBO0652960.1 M48 family metallopeptidase [Streptomyces triculaminicus]QSY51453.1 M48 family metallopeptidase [Streptomyces griseocarneus]